ncbi:MAG: SRPBCC domain-containing protein [Parvularculaceae bacterium]
MTGMKIVKTVFLKAPPEHVWKFLTQPEKLALWFHLGERELTPGATGRY